MGTNKNSLLTDAQIIERYLVGGESQAMIGLRARKTTAYITEVLTRNNVPIRTPAEYYACSVKLREAWPSTQRTRSLMREARRHGHRQFQLGGHA